MEMLMKFYHAELIDSLNIPVGTTVKLESLRQAVVPPYLMLVPFIEVPDGIVIEDQYALDEDGVHGSVYLLRATAACEGEIVVGFRDIQTNEVTHRKAIRLTTSEVSMKFYRAELVDSLNIPVGTTVKLESLRQAVVPPYLMLIPFIEVPDGIVIEDQYALDEDGVHGSVYLLRATAACEGETVVGFRDIQTNEVTHRKVIRLTTSEVPMKFYHAELIDSLDIPVGTTVKLESLRQAVVPPYLMLMPFIEMPDGIVIEDQYALDEDGVHGSVYLLKATAACEGEIVVGFRDIQTNEVTHRKAIRVTTS
jgi:hypothetical protein